jgi:hypothetical protein
MVPQISRTNFSFEPIFASYDNQFLKSQRDKNYIKKKKNNNTMLIVIEFIANTNYEIQI